MSTRALLAVMGACLALGILSLWFLGERQEYTLSIAAGQRSEQAYQLAKAIKTVAERHHPEFRIEIFETRGSLQNAKLMDRGVVDLAISADGRIAFSGHAMDMETPATIWHLLNVWDVDRGEPVGPVMPQFCWIKCVDMTPDALWVPDILSWDFRIFCPPLRRPRRWYRTGVNDSSHGLVLSW